MKRTIMTVAVLGALLLGTVGAASPASAAPAAPAGGAASLQVTCIYESTGDGVRLRTGPDSNATVLGLLYRGDRFSGDRAAVQNGFRYGYSAKHGKYGWVSTGFLRQVGCPV
ncbi:SH3 domain-containing protein [Longispora sp. NPDC051575]|uniref:SH3 domain-containing protein n=1 Tax=Longispora sp. NPDC051575 TaxID=3154943 RepID=UPI0034354A08